MASPSRCKLVPGVVTYIVLSSSLIPVSDRSWPEQVGRVNRDFG
jgi:hypothetical protein